MPALFENASEEDRECFAFTLWRWLANMSGEQKREWWDRWLRAYWEDRLVGVPAPLYRKEVAMMLEWPVALDELFPEAVGLAAQMPPAELEHSSALHYLVKSDLWPKISARGRRVPCLPGRISAPVGMGQIIRNDPASAAEKIA